MLTENPVFFPEGDFKKILAAAYKNTAAGVESSAEIEIVQDLPGEYAHAQQRNVQVHRLITQGTFEEKINAMLQSKKNCTSSYICFKSIIIHWLSRLL